MKEILIDEKSILTNSPGLINDKPPLITIKYSKFKNNNIFAFLKRHFIPKAVIEFKEISSRDKSL